MGGSIQTTLAFPNPVPTSSSCPFLSIPSSPGSWLNAQLSFSSFLCYLVLWPQEGALSPGSGKANPPLVQDLNTQSPGSTIRPQCTLTGSSPAHTHIFTTMPLYSRLTPMHAHPPFAPLLLCVFVMFDVRLACWTRDKLESQDPKQVL